MTFTTAPEDRYFEDYVVGAIHEFGSIAVEEAEAIAFAKRFDPLPLYTDSSAAEQSTSGRMIVSGWYTASLAARLFVEHYLPRVASLGSPGIDELRWLKPVRAGDTLSIRVIVLETRPSRSKPDRGTGRSYREVLNQHGEIAMTMKVLNLIRRRPKH